MKNKIIHFDDNADVMLFATRIATVLCALRSNNVYGMPKKQTLNMEINAAYLYKSVCQRASKKAAKNYLLKLYNRLVTDFPEDAIFPKGDLKEKEEFSSEDLKAYDAVYVYLTNEQGGKSFISEDGELILEMEKSKDDTNTDINSGEAELKSIDDEYYVY